MILAFELSMPRNSSWNNNWSGEGRSYVIVKTFTAKKHHEKAKKLIEQRSFHYSWDDGWGATKVSALLGLTLIVRTKGREELVPMAGFPYQHLDGYLAKMVQQGLTVSVVEGI